MSPHQHRLRSGTLLAGLLVSLSAPVLASECAHFYPAGFQLIQGKNDQPVPALAKPAKSVSFTEPTYGTCEYRATDHTRDGLRTFARNDYSRRQAFNRNNTYYIAYAYDGSWHLYDANSQRHVRRLTPLAGDAEPQWSSSDPDTLFYLPPNGGTRVHKLDVRTNGSSVAIDFNGKLPAWARNAAHIWTRSEGSPSSSLRYWGFLVYDANFRLLGHIVWDLSLNRLKSSRQEAGITYDNASISPSGRWYVTTGSNGVWAWSADFTRKARLAADGGIHSDIGIGKNGNDMFISVDYESNLGDVYFTDLDNCPTVSPAATTAPICARTVLFSMYQDRSWATFHFSAKAFSKPGWVVMSTYDAATKTSTLPWYRDKVMVVELASNPRIYPIAATRRVPVISGDSTGAGNYWAEPHASVNRDLTRVIFNSNWGISSGVDVDAYTIRLPANAFD